MAPQSPHRPMPVLEGNLAVAEAHAVSTQLGQQVFGYEALHAHQRFAVECFVARRDAMIVVPTGTGKSMCYTLPALMGKGLVLVISPLIALIRDQLARLQAKSIAAVALDSLQDGAEKRDVWQALESGSVRVLFVSPERMALPLFRERLRSLQVKMIAIDEAHCISSWGFHFRPDYQRLGSYLQDFPDVPRLALTATATQAARREIAEALALREPVEFVDNPQRANLLLDVRRFRGVHEQFQAVVQELQRLKGRGIVYASTRKNVATLVQYGEVLGLDLLAYHAGLPGYEREAVQRRFRDEDKRVVVATNAFGMGIDMPDIRFVLHAGMPGSLESYVQEVGRAGRDGRLSHCIMFYGPRDYYIQKFMIEKSLPAEESLGKAYSWLRQQVFAACRFRRSDEVEGLVARELAVKVDEAETICEMLVRLNLLCCDEILDEGGGGLALSLDNYYSLASEGNWETARCIYAFRKSEYFRKLGDMHAYVKADAGRYGILERYFK